MRLGWEVVDFQRQHEWKNSDNVILNKPTCGLKSLATGRGGGWCGCSWPQVLREERASRRRTASGEVSGCFHTVPFSPCSAHFSRAQCTLCYFRKPWSARKAVQKLGGICRCFRSLRELSPSLSERKHLPHSLHMTPRLASGPRTP